MPIGACSNARRTSSATRRGRRGRRRAPARDRRTAASESARSSDPAARAGVARGAASPHAVQAAAAGPARPPRRRAPAVARRPRRRRGRRSRRASSAPRAADEVAIAAHTHVALHVPRRVRTVRACGHPIPCADLCPTTRCTSACARACPFVGRDVCWGAPRMTERLRAPEVGEADPIPTPPPRPHPSVAPPATSRSPHCTIRAGAPARDRKGHRLQSNPARWGVRLRRRRGVRRRPRPARPAPPRQRRLVRRRPPFATAVDDDGLAHLVVPRLALAVGGRREAGGHEHDAGGERGGEALDEDAAEQLAVEGAAVAGARAVLGAHDEPDGLLAERRLAPADADGVVERGAERRQRQGDERGDASRVRVDVLAVGAHGAERDGHREHDRGHARQHQREVDQPGAEALPPTRRRRGPPGAGAMRGTCTGPYGPCASTGRRRTSSTVVRPMRSCQVWPSRSRVPHT